MLFTSVLLLLILTEYKVFIDILLFHDYNNVNEKNIDNKDDVGIPVH